jgi:predicted aldo/keto reductase-like oxidoreductase
MNAGAWETMQQADLAGFFDEARKDGRIKHAGFSFHDRFSVFQDILNGFDWDFTLIQYNYLDQDYQAGVKGLKLAAQKGVGVIVMEPLRGGFLINHVPDAQRAHFAKVRPDWSLADWGLRWLWDQPEVAVVLSGMSSMEQVEENLNIACAAEALTDEDKATVDFVRNVFLGKIKVNCTNCGYCLPCPEGVNIPETFSLYNDYFLSDAEKARAEVKRLYSTLVLAPEEMADRCTRCGQCEKMCPQHLPVGELMTKVAEVFCR